MPETPEKELEFTPYGNYLLVLPDEAETQIGSIHLPEQARDKPCVCTVIRTGMGQRYNPELPLIPCYSNAGDKILVARHAIMPFKLTNGVVLSIISEGDVYGKFSLADAEEASGAESPETPA